LLQPRLVARHRTTELPFDFGDQPGANTMTGPCLDPGSTAVVDWDPGSMPGWIDRNTAAVAADRRRSGQHLGPHNTGFATTSITP